MQVLAPQETPLGQRTTRIFTYPYTRKDLEWMEAILTDAKMDGDIAKRWIFEDHMKITITTTEAVLA